MVAAHAAETYAARGYEPSSSWVASRLITGSGTRAIVHQEGELTAGILTSAVRVLEKHRLVREQPRANARWYKLTHDRFIPAIRRSNLAARVRSRAMIARISVCAATFVLAIAWLALIEPVASSVLDELKVLNSTGLTLTHIERSAKRKAAQIVAVCMENTAEGRSWFAQSPSANRIESVPGASGGSGVEPDESARERTTPW